MVFVFVGVCGGVWTCPYYPYLGPILALFRLDRSAVSEIFRSKTPNPNSLVFQNTNPKPYFVSTEGLFPRFSGPWAPLGPGGRVGLGGLGGVEVNHRTRLILERV